MAMNSLGFEYQSNFARRHFGQGKEEGRAEGRAEVVLKLLALRFGPLNEGIQARIQRARDTQVDAVVERVLTARTLEEVLGALA